MLERGVDGLCVGKRWWLDGCREIVIGVEGMGVGGFAGEGRGREGDIPDVLSWREVSTGCSPVPKSDPVPAGFVRRDM